MDRDRELRLEISIQNTLFNLQNKVEHNKEQRNSSPGRASKPNKFWAQKEIDMPVRIDDKPRQMTELEAFLYKTPDDNY